MSDPLNDSRRTLLDVRDLKKHFPVRRGMIVRATGTVKAVDGTSLSLREGETLGLVGESGCGKTTLGRCIVRAYQPTSGEIRYRDKAGQEIDLAPLSERELRRFRPDIQMIFQDPFGSLNPRMTLLHLIGEPLRVNKMGNDREIKDRVADLLRVVGLRPEYMTRYPHAFSGGQRQRIGIARALTLNPRLIVCDEPVSALDVSVQAQILNLLQDLQDQFNLTYLFVAHDLSVVEHISDHVAVMYVGKIVERSDTDSLFRNPLHPYTAALMSAVPKPDPRARVEPIVLEGDIADPANPPSGCYFHPRCSFCIDRCKREAPELREVQPGHWAACHRAEELQLKGVYSAGAGG
ncbi:MAG: dipeptide ABC transporter ATP-binding protein [Chloroflexi bacterium]|nr:dipeptide ABC transporter ATP-binding protein [Chloroflexota bacterium]